MQRLILFVLLFVSSQVGAQQTPRVIPIDGLPSTLGYLEYLPPAYETATGNFPVLIHLHGGGEEGDGSPASLEKVKSWGPPSLINQGDDMCFTIDDKEECFIVLSPQIYSSVHDWPRFVARLIDHVLENYKADPNRIYLTGLSRGGKGVYDFASNPLFNRPNKLAAIAPIAAFFNNPEHGCLISARQIAVWAFHGREDTVIPYSFGLNAFNSVLLCENPKPVSDMIFTTYSEDGKYHDAWIPAYNPSHKYHNPNLYEWLLKHSRPDGPVAVEDDSQNTSTLIYPNPSGNEIHLTANSFLTYVSEVTISDLAGREVFKVFSAPDRKINISQLQRGAYIVSIRSASGKSSATRLIKIK